jgi:hypothetical protein
MILLEARAFGTASSSGQQIYLTRCASCHGNSGEGVDEEYPHPLVGERSLVELTKYIEKSMPKGTREKCVGEDAKRVAAFIYDAFYSPVAQARNKPAPVELSRLTVRQYQNAVADLLGSFRGPAHWDFSHGVKGEYFKSRRIRGNERVLERLDPVVQFDFEHTGLDAEKFDPNGFSARWEGSILAPETGEFEFIIRTKHAARLWINDLQQPLIDAWVKSGEDAEFRMSIRVVSGRTFPLRLEFSTAKQGVDDSQKNKKEKPPALQATLSLGWLPPFRATETIPAQFLAPVQNPEVFVLQTAFPPDDRSVGWERGTLISKEWDQATTESAIEVASYVEAHLNELARTSDDAKDRTERLREFGARFIERAFRRPLSDEQCQLFVDRQFKDSGDPVTAVKRIVLLSLKSPRFLYREIDNQRDSHATASCISFGLWDSVPDQQLLDAAASGQLVTREQIAWQVARMLGDLRARSILRGFFRQWLRMDQLPEIAKDPQRFPGFDESMVSDLRRSLELFLDDVVFGEASDFRQLLLMDSIYLNGRLARFYGVDLPADAPFQRVPLNAEHRAGVLSHPYLRAGFAYTATSSPIHRGVFISRSVLGRSLRPPPEAVAPLAPELHASLTTRERIALQTKPEACQSCHAMINPLGFTLENFDAVGRFRNEEQGKRIDASGTYVTRQGELVRFAGVRYLARFLADSEETQAAFVEQLLHYMIKQPLRAFDGAGAANLQQSFAQNQFHIRKLAAEIVTRAAILPEPVGERTAVTTK